MPRGRPVGSKNVSKIEIPVIHPINSNPGDTRAISLGVRTAIVDKPPQAGVANEGIFAVKQTPGDEDMSTTQKLFGDVRAAFEEGDASEVSQSPAELPPLPPVQHVQQTPEEPISEETPEVPAPTKPNAQTEGDDFIDWDKLAGKKVRLKVDGKEVIATAEDLKKYSDQEQIKRHLAEAADKVGDERRKLAEERRQIQELRNQRQDQYQAPLQNGQPYQQTYQGLPQGLPNQIPQPDYSNPVLQRIQFLEQQLQQMSNNTAPVIYQSNRIALDQSLKARGFNDFNDLWPEIVANTSPQLIQEMNGNEMRAAELTYFQIKAKQGTRPQQVQQAPQIVPRRIETPVPIPAVQIDGGSGSMGANNDDSAGNYRQAFRRAVALVDDREAWNEVLRQKGVLPS
jgi:hypothetical protein